jgi:hypothetical protein
MILFRLAAPNKNKPTTIKTKPVIHLLNMLTPD